MDICFLVQYEVAYYLEDGQFIKSTRTFNTFLILRASTSENKHEPKT